MKKHLSMAALILALLAGVSLLLYPTVSNYWNARHASRAVANYTQEAQALDRDAYDRMLAEAAAYNRSLLTRENAFALTDAQQAQYDRLLDISGTGVMGYIEIPSINVSLPVCHGTSDSVLQIAVGHLSWTSLPVGGAGTPYSINSHRLLVRGHRVETAQAEEAVRLVSDGIQIEPLLVAPVVALPMLLALLLVLLLSGNKPPHRDDEDSGPN